ncbi:MAG: membrane protein insertion efficiency factor YidD [Candidatus Puniceispirillaceae bacterium]
MKMMKLFILYPLLGIIRAYQLFLSPLLGVNCRFQPSCSHYAIEALNKFGPLRGSALTFKRIVRCHPWGGSGYDPVPPTDDKAAVADKKQTAQK